MAPWAPDKQKPMELWSDKRLLILAGPTFVSQNINNMVLLIFPIIFYPAKTCNFDEMANISIFCVGTISESKNLESVSL